MEIIQSSSSSSSTPMIWKYDVFVSFRGKDTRNNFTDHLFAALHGKGFVTFRDDTKLRKGENIAIELLQAIEGSQILIVVFSKNYASSTWCLQELAKIAHCIEVQEQTVLPVFYDVSPSEVRKQSGNYETAFVEHEVKFKQHLEMVQGWRKALEQVANLSGWDLRDKPQHAEIGKISKQVALTLGHKLSTLSVLNDIVGIHSRVEELERLLILDSNDNVRVVGICGMGGIGKTTLATSLYHKIAYQFDVICFVDDVSKLFREHGPIEAQKQILSQTLNEENLPLYHLPMTTSLMRTRLRHKKALIVLDNADEVKQLDKLAIKRESLGAGSRIIIISRDEHILREHQVDEVYKVQLLNFQGALKLFCIKAFKCDVIMRGYNDLTYEVLKYVGGLPLAINVLGSFLFGRDVFEWRSALVRLRETPEKDIMDVLRISFDALKDTEKEIFLDISCFFSENLIWYDVKTILDIRGFHPDIGIRVLIDKSLLEVNKYGLYRMHDLLKELGRNIVREKSPKEPRKWSRLWDYKDFHNVMLENLATENLEAIVVNTWKEKCLRVDALSKMSHLKLLILKNLKFSGSLNHLSTELGYLHWENYPFKYLPPSFQPHKLVELIMPYSSIKQGWEYSKQPLYNLRRMDFSHSESLVKIPDFREVPNLEFLILEGCIKLVQIGQSIGILEKLVLLNLKNCKNLVSIPNSIFHLSSLEELNLSGCSKLLRNNLLEKPKDAEHLEKLGINESSIQRQSSTSLYKFLKFPPIHFMHSRRHQDSVGSLLPYLPRFPCLQRLDLSFCNLLQIPDAIGSLHSLEKLNLGGNSFVTLPCSIKELSKLRFLNLEHCKQLRYLPELPSRRQTSAGWSELYIFDCPKLCLTKRFYSIAFSWLIQHFKLHMQSSFSCGRYSIRIVIPGVQIPRWFSQQNVGSTIHMDSSHIMQNQNWIGVAFCVTFVTHEDPTNLTNPKLYLDFTLMYGFQPKPSDSWVSYVIPIHFRKDLVTVESDHLVLLYFSRKEFIDYYLSEITSGTNDLEGVEFVSSIYQQPQGLHVEVKMCGYEWVFEEDLEQLIHSMEEHSGNSSVLEGNFLTNNELNHGTA